MQHPGIVIGVALSLVCWTGCAQEASQTPSPERSSTKKSEAKPEAEELRKEVAELRKQLEIQKAEIEAAKESAKLERNSESLRVFLQSARKLVTSIRVGLSLNDFTTQTIEVTANSKEALREDTEQALRSEIQKFVLSINDAIPLWRYHLIAPKPHLALENEGGNIKLPFAIALKIGGRWAQDEFSEFIETYELVDKKLPSLSIVEKRGDSYRMDLEGGVRRLLVTAATQFEEIERILSREKVINAQQQQFREVQQQVAKALADFPDFNNLPKKADEAPITDAERGILLKQLGDRIASMKAGAKEARNEFVASSRSAIELLKPDMDYRDFLHHARPIQASAIKAAWAVQPEPLDESFRRLINSMEHANFLMQIQDIEIQAKRMGENWTASAPRKLEFLSMWEKPEHWVTNFGQILSTYTSKQIGANETEISISTESLKKEVLGEISKRFQEIANAH